MSQFESVYRDVQAASKHMFPNVGAEIVHHTHRETDWAVTARVDEPVCDVVWTQVASELRL